MRRIAVGLIGALFLAVPAAAARQGALADGSRGSVTITASVAGGARLAGRVDTVAPGDEGMAVCLASNTATRAVTLVAAGASADAVRWTDAAGRTLSSGASFTGRGTGDCNSAARLVLAAAARPGTLSLLIAPE